MNSSKSTGPSSPEGKGRSRLNAIKHGLTSLVVVPEDAEALQAEASVLFYSLRPRNEFQRDLLHDVALCNIRISRAQRIERRLRDKVALRAMTSWDDDRRLDAERLSRDLPSRPAEVVAELKQTPQGCDWLIETWAKLANVAEATNTWPVDCRRLAFDLLGTRPEFRIGHPGATIDHDGRTIDKGEDPIAVARAQIASIRASRKVAVEHDEVDRALAEADLTDEPTAEIRRLRRYESSLHRKVRWCLARFHDPMPDHRPNLNLAPTFKLPSEAEYLAEARAEEDAKADRDAQFEAEYHAKRAELREARQQEEAKDQARKDARARRKAEGTARAQDEATPAEQNEAIIPGQNEAIIEPVAEDKPSVVLSSDRRESQIRKAETRREARQRKLDRRRA